MYLSIDCGKRCLKVSALDEWFPIPLKSALYNTSLLQRLYNRNGKRSDILNISLLNWEAYFIVLGVNDLIFHTSNIYIDKCKNEHYLLENHLYTE